MRIGFDLDGLFVDKPPMVPKKLIERLYRGRPSRKLSYRFPRTRFEQVVRQLSHYWLLRPPIKENIEFVYLLPKNSLYLISSRYSFLKIQTDKILGRYGLSKRFACIFINLKNEQPHIYKERLIKKYKIGVYVDDDLQLLAYLAKTCQGMRLFWYNPQGLKNVPSGVKSLRFLKDIRKDT